MTASDAHVTERPESSPGKEKKKKESTLTKKKKNIFVQLKTKLYPKKKRPDINPKRSLQTENTPQTPRQEQQTSSRPKKENYTDLWLGQVQENSATTLHPPDHPVHPAIKGGFTEDKKKNLKRQDSNHPRVKKCPPEPREAASLPAAFVLSMYDVNPVSLGC